MGREQRRIRIIRPRLQLRLIASFLGITALALILQYVVFVHFLSDVAARYPDQGAHMLADMAPKLGLVLGLSFGLLLPVTLLVGVLVTHRIAGPVHRLESYLGQVLAGSAREDCRLREGDELQELCGLINQVTATARQEATARSPETSPPALQRSVA
jgi:hypothetical protein